MKRPNSILAPRPVKRELHRILLFGGMCGLAVISAVSSTWLFAQDQSTQTFNLPSATPTPTPAPQGPEDERVGVPISPRVIPEAPQSTPAPVNTATPAPTPTPSVSPPSSQPTENERRVQPSQASQAPAEPAERTPTTSAPSRQEPATPSVQNSDARGAGIGVDETVDPGFESLEGDLEGLAPRSPDGWYDVDEIGNEGQTVSASPAGEVENAAAAPSTIDKIWSRITAQSEVFLALIALMTALAAMLVWARIQRKRAELTITDDPETANFLTAGVRASMGDKASNAPRNDVPLDEEFGLDEAEDDFDPPSEAITEPGSVTKPEVELESDLETEANTLNLPEPEKEKEQEVVAQGPIFVPVPPPHAPFPERAPASAKEDQKPKTRSSPFAGLIPSKPSAPEPRSRPTPPLDVDLSLEIKGASRSLMRMSVDFTLEIANRTDQAVRDLNIAGELSSAREGAAGPAPVDKTKHLTKVDRIAPQQSRRVSGTLQLPMGEVTAIRQNGNPVVIPLVHFRLGTANQPAIKRTFVVGTPSTTSATRVHPLLIDGPPGGLPPLRAQLIKQS